MTLEQNNRFKIIEGVVDDHGKSYLLNVIDWSLGAPCLLGRE